MLQITQNFEAKATKHNIVKHKHTHKIELKSARLNQSHKIKCIEHENRNKDNFK